ncbi:MAG TPA: SH3 domain-containing protein [Alphaproteobacteria bacterium]|nr:SH3 domain-containing protein [Alphaproteobacteria bacterium]
MRLHSILVMVVAPLALAVGAVLIFTPRDILRQPVLPAGGSVTSLALDRNTSLETASITIANVPDLAIEPPSLIVVASQPDTVASMPLAADSTADQRWVVASGLNLRAGPGVDSRFIATLPYGTAVEVLETSGSWARVDAGDHSGWLSTRFLTANDPNAAVN